MDHDRYSAAGFGQSFYPGFIWSRATWPDGRTQSTVAVDKALAWGALGVAAYVVYARPKLVTETMRAVAKTSTVPLLLAGGALALWRAYENDKKKALPTSTHGNHARPRARLAPMFRRTDFS